MSLVVIFLAAAGTAGLGLALLAVLWIFTTTGRYRIERDASSGSVLIIPRSHPNPLL
jgi:hypothetical protein